MGEQIGLPTTIADILGASQIFDNAEMPNKDTQDDPRWACLEILNSDILTRHNKYILEE